MNPKHKALDKVQKKYYGPYKGGKTFSELKTRAKGNAIKSSKEKMEDETKVFSRQMTPKEFNLKWKNN